MRHITTIQWLEFCFEFPHLEEKVRKHVNFLYEKWVDDVNHRTDWKQIREERLGAKFCALLEEQLHKRQEKEVASSSTDRMPQGSDEQQDRLARDRQLLQQLKERLGLKRSRSQIRNRGQTPEFCRKSGQRYLNYAPPMRIEVGKNV